MSRHARRNRRHDRLDDARRGAYGDSRGGFFTRPGVNSAGDCVYATATRDHGAGVTTDVRNAVECPAFDGWRMSLLTPSPLAFPPLNEVCPTGFGNSDIYAFTTE